MSENVLPIKSEVVVDSATFATNMGDNRSVPPSNLVPRTPPGVFQQPQRPQFDNQPPRSPQPRFPQNSTPRFAARAPEFQPRPPFPPPQQQQQQLTQDQRVRFPTQNPVVQRPPAFGPAGGRPPGPVGQRPGSATIRPPLQDPSFKPQNVDPRGNLNGDVIKQPNLNTTSNNPKESVENMEQKLNRRNEEFKNQSSVKQNDGMLIQNSQNDLTTNISKIRDGIAERSYQRQQSLNPTPDDSRKEFHKSISLVQEPNEALPNQNQKLNNQSSRNLTGTESKDHSSPNQNQQNMKNDSDSFQNKNDSSKLSKHPSEELIKEKKEPKHPEQVVKNPSNEIPKTMTVKEEDKKGVYELKLSQQPDKSKIPNQNSIEARSKIEAKPQGVVVTENIKDTAEPFKRQDEHRPPSREDNETYRRKDDHYRPPSRAVTVDHSKNKDEHLMKQKDDIKDSHHKKATEPSKQKEDFRPPSRSSEEPPKKGNVSRPLSRSSSRLSTAEEEKGKVPTGKGLEAVSPDKKTKIEITVPSPERNQTKHKPLHKNSIEKSEKHVTQRPTSLHRSDSYKNSMGSTNLLKPDGDNDSGVDESTQGNETRNTENHHKSNKKTSKIPSPKASSTPTKEKSIVRGSKSPSLKSSGDVSGATTPGGSEKKKVPMNKVQVGSAPSPNLKEVKSKIGSLSNASYKPGGGQVKIENRKLNFEAKPKIAAKNEAYIPHGGEKKIMSQKLQWNAKSKIGSLENTTHKPKGGDKKIETVKLDFKEKAKPKVGSKGNMKYVPGGGDIKIENKKLDIKAQSKVGSLDNVKHRPGGGDKKIFDDKDYIRQMSGNSLTTSLTNSQTSSQADVREPTSDENLNKHH